MRFLNIRCSNAIPREAHKELDDWRTTSQTVSTVKGHYHERQLAVEGTIPSSTIYDILSMKFGRTLLPVPSAVGKMFVYTAKIIELDWET